MGRKLGSLGLAMVTANALAMAFVGVARAEPAVPGAPAADASRLADFNAPADIARGKALFTGTCGAYCHRPSGPTAGQAATDAPSLFDCAWIHGGSDTQIFHTISKGVDRTRMVAFGGALPDEEIWRIIAYLRSASQCATAPKH